MQRGARLGNAGVPPCATLSGSSLESKSSAESREGSNPCFKKPPLAIGGGGSDGSGESTKGPARSRRCLQPRCKAVMSKSFDPLH